MNTSIFTILRVQRKKKKKKHDHSSVPMAATPTTAQLLRAKYEAAQQAQTLEKEKAIATGTLALLKCLCIYVEEVADAGVSEVILFMPESSALVYAKEANTAFGLDLSLPKSDLSQYFNDMWKGLKEYCTSGFTLLKWEDFYDHENDFCECAPDRRGCQHHVRLSLNGAVRPCHVNIARLKRVSEDMVLWTLGCLERVAMGACSSMPWSTVGFTDDWPKHAIFMQSLSESDKKVLGGMVREVVQDKHGFKWEVNPVSGAVNIMF